MVDRIPTEDPPARLASQLNPSTNTLVITLNEDFDIVGRLQQDILRILDIDISFLQCLDFSLFDLLRQIRATFFDVRDAQKTFVKLQSALHLSVEFDLKCGTNRSVVLPRGNLSLDLIHSRMTDYGEIEKIWFQMPITNYDQDNIVVDYFDSRAPLNIVRKLENAL